MAGVAPYAELERNNQSNNPAFTTAVLQQIFNGGTYSDLHPYVFESREFRGDATYLMVRFPSDSEFILFGVTYIAFRGYFKDLNKKEYPSTVCLMNVHEVVVFRGTLFNLSDFRNFLNAFLKMLKGLKNFEESKRRMLDVLQELEGVVAASRP